MKHAQTNTTNAVSLYKYKYLVEDDACFISVYSAIRLYRNYSRTMTITAAPWQCLVLNRLNRSVNAHERDQLTKTGHGWEHLQEPSRSPPPLSLWHHWYGWQQNPVEWHSRFSVLIANVCRSITRKCCYCMPLLEVHPLISPGCPPQSSPGYTVINLFQRYKTLVTW